MNGGVRRNLNSTRQCDLRVLHERGRENHYEDLRPTGVA